MSISKSGRGRASMERLDGQGLPALLSFGQAVTPLNSNNPFKPSLALNVSIGKSGRGRASSHRLDGQGLPALPSL